MYVGVRGEHAEGPHAGNLPLTGSGRTSGAGGHRGHGLILDWLRHPGSDHTRHCDGDRDHDGGFDGVRHYGHRGRGHDGDSRAGGAGDGHQLVLLEVGGRGVGGGGRLPEVPVIPGQQPPALPDPAMLRVGAQLSAQYRGALYLLLDLDEENDSEDDDHHRHQQHDGNNEGRVLGQVVGDNCRGPGH